MCCQYKRFCCIVPMYCWYTRSDFTNRAVNSNTQQKSKNVVEKKIM